MIILKKGIIILFIIVLIVLFSKEGSSNVLIPKDAIRFRIIANSDEFLDQEEKITIKTEIEPILSDILSSARTKEETKELIDNNIENIENIVSKYESDFTINYGFNYFPEKIYKGTIYQAGNYESLVITLGEGLGDNWWCVLFPPLCLLEASADNYDDVTYSFFIKDIIEKF